MKNLIVLFQFLLFICNFIYSSNFIEEFNHYDKKTVTYSSLNGELAIQSSLIKLIKDFKVPESDEEETIDTQTARIIMQWNALFSYSSSLVGTYYQDGLRESKNRLSDLKKDANVKTVLKSISKKFEWVEDVKSFHYLQDPSKTTVGYGVNPFFTPVTMLLKDLLSDSTPDQKVEAAEKTHKELKKREFYFIYIERINKIVEMLNNLKSLDDNKIGDQLIEIKDYICESIAYRYKWDALECKDKKKKETLKDGDLSENFPHFDFSVQKQLSDINPFNVLTLLGSAFALSKESDVMHAHMHPDYVALKDNLKHLKKDLEKFLAHLSNLLETADFSFRKENFLEHLINPSQTADFSFRKENYQEIKNVTDSYVNHFGKSLIKKYIEEAKSYSATAEQNREKIFRILMKMGEVAKFFNNNDKTEPFFWLQKVRDELTHAKKQIIDDIDSETLEKILELLPVLEKKLEGKSSHRDNEKAEKLNQLLEDLSNVLEMGNKPLRNKKNKDKSEKEITEIIEQKYQGIFCKTCKTKNLILKHCYPLIYSLIIDFKDGDKDVVFEFLKKDKIPNKQKLKDFLTKYKGKISDKTKMLLKNQTDVIEALVEEMFKPVITPFKETCVEESLSYLEKIIPIINKKKADKKLENKRVISQEEAIIIEYQIIKLRDSLAKMDEDIDGKLSALVKDKDVSKINFYNELKAYIDFFKKRYGNSKAHLKPFFEHTTSDSHIAHLIGRYDLFTRLRDFIKEFNSLTASYQEKEQGILFRDVRSVPFLEEQNAISKSSLEFLKSEYEVIKHALSNPEDGTKTIEEELELTGVAKILKTNGLTYKEQRIESSHSGRFIDSLSSGTIISMYDREDYLNSLQERGITQKEIVEAAGYALKNIERDYETLKVGRSKNIAERVRKVHIAFGQ